MSSADPTRIAPGDVIDDFEIAEVLATGGSSTTFRATNRTLARDVSLKYLHPAVFSGDTAAIDAARADATRIARLEHPGITPVFAAGLHAGGLYIASAMPQGHTLAELGAEGAITPTETARVLADVASALEAAHAQGVVHRDLRPECVTVDRWGHGVVRDFGVTRTSGRTGLLTRAEVLESLRYTAPELVLGRPATPAADVYELAAVAVWCLTGTPPYRDRPAAEYVVFRAQAAPPGLRAPDGAPATTINTVLKAAMALDPAARPSPTELTSALSYAVSRLPEGVGDAGCPLRVSEDELPDEPPAAGDPVVALPGFGDVTRAEQRRPLAVAAAGDVARPPWNTYAACAAVAFVAGLGGLVAGRASAPGAPAAVKVGAVSFDTGETWTRVAGTGDSKLDGERLAGAPGESATVGVVGGARLPGDPLPPDLLPTRAATPRPATSGGVGVVSYAGGGSRAVARPTSTGTIVALCSGSVALGRCAALVTRAKGPGEGLSPAPASEATAALRKSLVAAGRASRKASVGLRGSRIEQSGAAGRLAGALRSATASLTLSGLDAGTAAQMKQVGGALDDEAGAFEDLGSAIDRRSDVAFDAATDLVRASRRRLTSALAALRRAGYPIH